MSIIHMIEMERPPLAIREDGSLHGKRTFEFLSSDHTTTIHDMLIFAGFPTRGDPHPDHAPALLRTFEPEAVAGFHNLHILTCQYDTRLQFDDDESTQNALRKAGFRAQDRQVPAVFDAFGRPNVNTAGDLIPGLVMLANEYVAPVTVKLPAVPVYLFTLNNTLNDDTVTFRGIDFPAGTLMLKNIQMEDEPEFDPDTGVGHWVITFDVIHNPDGFYEIHPNKGKHELIYQTRLTANDDWEDVTPADYDTKTPTSDRQIVKRRIRGEDDQTIADDMWLDARGQAVRVPQITTTTIGNGSMTAGSATLTLSSGAFNTDGSHVGASIAVIGAGPHGRAHHTLIESVSSTTVAILKDKATQTVSSKAVYLPGVIGRRIINQPLADWSVVPLPNNDP